MKTLKFASVIVALVALGTMARPAAAQGNGLVFRLPAQSGGHQASQPIQPAQPATPSPAYPAYPTYPGYSAYPAYPVAYTVLPAIVMSDGTIYANFGYGYVPVRQACTQTTAPRVLNGSDLMWRGGNPLTTTQPAPAQMTASQQMIHGTPQPRQGPATAACYRMDAYGPVVLVR